MGSSLALRSDKFLLLRSGVAFRNVDVRRRDLHRLDGVVVDVRRRRHRRRRRSVRRLRRAAGRRCQRYRRKGWNRTGFFKIAFKELIIKIIQLQGPETLKANVGCCYLLSFLYK